MSDPNDEGPVGCNQHVNVEQGLFKHRGKAD